MSKIFTQKSEKGQKPLKDWEKKTLKSYVKKRVRLTYRNKIFQNPNEPIAPCTVLED